VTIKSRIEKLEQQKELVEYVPPQSFFVDCFEGGQPIDEANAEILRQAEAARARGDKVFIIKHCFLGEHPPGSKTIDEPKLED
jgi:hypothetical protein